MVRFTEALIRSNEALFSNSTGSNLLSIYLFKGAGVILPIDFPTIKLPLTIDRDSGEDENLSIPSPFLARLTSVSVTERDFFENIRARTIIIPAPINQAAF